MTLMSLYFLLILVTVEVMVVTGETGSQVSRQKRSDDGGPLEAVVEHLSQQLTSLNAQLTSVNAKVATLEATTNTLKQTVAFGTTAGSNPVVNATGHGRILINQIHLNVGNAFDRETGFFTAPTSGVYQFTATFMAVPSSHKQVWADIVVDGQVAAHSTSDSRNGYYDKTTMQTMVQVSAGKRVYVRNSQSSSASFYGYTHLTFSGFLLHAD